MNKSFEEIIRESIEYNSFDCSLIGHENDIALAEIGIIDEGLIKTYPMDKTEKYLRNYLNFKGQNEIFLRRVKDQQKGETFVIRLMLNWTDFKEVEENMFRAMKLCGFSLSIKARQNFHGFPCVAYQFEKKFDSLIDIKQWKYIYHATPHSDKIMKNGFSPRADNSFMLYPPRVYFFKGNTTMEQMEALTLRLMNYNRKRFGRYRLMVVETEKIRKDIKFYPDQQYKQGIFTYENISSSSVADIIDFSE